MIEQENILRLAEKHCICTAADMKEFDHEGLLAFVAAVKAEAVAETREACAKVCERISDAFFQSEDDDDDAMCAAMDCEEAIRAMAATPSREGEA